MSEVPMYHSRGGMDGTKRFRGGLAFKAHRLLHHSTLGLRVIKQKKKEKSPFAGRRADCFFGESRARVEEHPRSVCVHAPPLRFQ